MQLQIDKLGKVSVTIEESYWDINKDYDKLTVVEKEGTFGTYISRKIVPAGTMLTDRSYWIPFSSLKEDIVLDYNAFTSKYGNELSLIKDHISEIDEQLDILNKLNENTNEAISTANKAIEAATTAINAAKNALSEAENIIDTNKKYTEKLDKIGTNVTIGSNSNIGNNNSIGNYNFIGNSSSIGNNVNIQNNVVMKENISVAANTTIASKTYIDASGLKVNEQHIIGRKEDGSVYIGSDSTGCNVIFNKDESYPINVQDNKYLHTKLKVAKDASIVLGSEIRDKTNNDATVFIGSGVVIDSPITIKYNGGNDVIKLSTNSNSEILLGEASILGTSVKLYKSGESLQYQGSKLYNVATTDDVDKRVNDIVAGAPEALDTLKEIADKLEDNDDVVAGIVKTLATKADKSDVSDITAEIASDYGAMGIQLYKDGIEKHPITDVDCIINSDSTHTFDGVAHIGSYANIGANVNIADISSLNTQINLSDTILSIGSDIFIGTSTKIGHYVTIDDDVTIGSHIGIGNSYNSGEDNPYGLQIANQICGIGYELGTGLVTVTGEDRATSMIIGEGFRFGSYNENEKSIGFTIGNNTQHITYDINSGLSIIGTNINKSDISINNNVSIGSDVYIGDGVHIDNKIKFTVENSNLMVEVNGTKYGVVLNTIS